MIDTGRHELTGKPASPAARAGPSASSWSAVLLLGLAGLTALVAW
ncbi:Transducin/WD40 repeat-like superfamily protein [Zea mays]|nr:Transducin/WD40 repeat-like superfamily protein [Zea mays]